MESRKQLVASILKFLKHELNTNKDLDDEGLEGLEVATQVLENAYNLENYEETSEPSLLEIYEASSLRRSSSTQRKKQPTEQDKLKAEELKVEGNNLMKTEDLRRAVESYSKAIDYDPSNAVYYCNRAAAYTKLNENIKAIADCQTAVSMDSNYSKAYGRMGLVYLNEKNYEKAVKAYEKAAELEPDNASYKSNLEVAREKLQTNNSQTNAEGGNMGNGMGSGNPAAGSNPLANMDLGSLLSNPAVMNMAQSFMQNPQMQNMFSSMMGGGGGGSSGAPTDGSQAGQTNTPLQADSAAGMPPPGGPPPNTGGFSLPEGLDFANIMNATQQFAAQMQQQNPEVVENLRSQFQQNGQNPPPSDQQNNGDNN